MRTLRVRSGVAAAALLLGSGLFAGCGGDEEPAPGDGADGADGAVPSAPAAPSPPEGSDDAAPDAAPDAVPTPPARGEEPLACPKVRDGIDAFNLGDLEATVARFEEAVELAERDVEERPSALSEQLLEAVEYYATLPPEDYPAASATSPEFLRWKNLTLIVCRYEAPPQQGQSPSEPPVEA